MQLVAGDKQSVITGTQVLETHPETMPAAVCLTSLRTEGPALCQPGEMPPTADRAEGPVLKTDYPAFDAKPKKWPSLCTNA